jgi:Tol biopolymer transport system component
MTIGMAIPIVAFAAMLVTSPIATATFPGDSGLILFMAETDAGHQLFTMRPDGTDTRQITRIEPDPTLGAEFPGAGRADWSPDGRTIVFNVNDCAIAFMDADGSDLRPVPPEQPEQGEPTICEATPAFAPDGQSIVYDRCQGMTCEIWAMDVEGIDRRLVSNACGAVPQVSPDGTHLATRGCTGLMVANMDGTDARRVTPDQDIAWKLDWAPDGSAIVFSDGSNDSSPEAINIATVAPDGTGLRYLTDVEAGSHAYVGSYSPDGGSIVYRLDRGDEHALFVLAADGSDVRQITEFSALRPRYLDWGAAPATAAR